MAALVHEHLLNEGRPGAFRIPRSRRPGAAAPSYGTRSAPNGYANGNGNGYANAPVPSLSRIPDGV